MKRKYKRCPRCEAKNHESNFRCSECGLIFSRAENGSNVLAKNLIHGGMANKTVMIKAFPKDVKKKKFLLLCGFLGIFGAHNFYVGRFKKAVFQLIFGIIAVLCVVVGPIIPFYETLMSFISFPIGFDAIMWVLDFSSGIFNSYRIPVAVDFVEEAKK